MRRSKSASRCSMNASRVCNNQLTDCMSDPVISVRSRSVSEIAFHITSSFFEQTSVDHFRVARENEAAGAADAAA